MPCFDPGAAEEEHKANYRKVNELTAHLCYAMRLIERGFGLSEIVDRPSLAAWWEEHKKLDAKRITSEIPPAP